MTRSAEHARWMKGLLVPGRFELAATAGPSGAIAFRALYRPRRLRARLATAASVFAVTHGIGLAAADVEQEARELCELMGMVPDGGALLRSKQSGGATLGLTEGGRLSVVVKVGHDHDRIRREATALQRVHGAIDGVLTPAVRGMGIWRDRLAMATEAMVPGRSERDVDIDEALAVAVALARGAAGHGPVVHGDFAPWNLLHTAAGIALVDWESSRFELDPMYDLAHFVTSKGALLDAHEAGTAVRLLTAKGSPGWRYLEALELDPHDAPAFVRRYVERTLARGNPTTRRYRRAMLEHLPREAAKPAA